MILVGLFILVLVVSPVSAKTLDAPLQATCTARDKTVSGSYNLYPTYAKVHYEVRYRVNSNCTISNIQDRARLVPDEDLPVKWYKSCTNGTSNCKTWSITLPSDGSWTTWRSETNSNANKQYRHYSSYGAAYAYGYRTLIP